MGTRNHLSINIGQNIIVGDLRQLILLVVFTRITSAFQTHLRKMRAMRAWETPWEKHMIALYVSSILMPVPLTFRAIDCLRVFLRYVPNRETFSVFDACLMSSVMLTFNWYQASRIRSSIQGGSYLTFEVFRRYTISPK